MPPMSRSEINDRIAETIANDPGAREQLLDDPRTVLAEITGIAIPDFVNVTVHEKTLTDIHLSLPHAGNTLSEDDLTLVAGGWSDNSKGDGSEWQQHMSMAR